MTIPIIRASRAAALAAALLVFSGCATKGDLRSMTDQVRELAVRQDSMLSVLTRQNAVTQDTLRRQADQLFEVRGDVSRQLQRILDDLASLRELTGQNQRVIASVRDQLEGLRRGWHSGAGGRGGFRGGDGWTTRGPDGARGRGAGDLRCRG